MSARVFISYAHQDAQYKDKVLQQLRVLETQGLLATWSDDRIAPGNDWYDELTRELNAASIVVLLITANFLTSKFILNEEVPRAFENRRDSGLRIVPVLCRPCAWEAVDWLKQLQMWPSGARPLWSRDGDDAEQLLSDLAREIARIAGKQIMQVSKREVVSGPVLDERMMAVEDQHGHGLMGVTEMLRLTIAQGAPLYNAGDHEACAKIYQHTVAFILSRLTPMLGTAQRLMPSSSREQSIADRQMDTLRERRLRSMPDPSQRGPEQDGFGVVHSFDASQEMLSAIVKELNAARDYAAGNGHSATNVAWRLRHTFDRLRIFASSVQAVSQPGAQAPGGSPSTSSLRHAVMSFLRSMDEIIDQSGIDSDDDYEVSANTSATLGVFASRYVADILGLTSPQTIPHDGQGLQRHYEHLTRVGPPASQPYRTIFNSRLFLRAVLATRDS
jgi:hypothetical protein